MLPLVAFPASQCLKVCPDRHVRMLVLGSGVGGGASETAPPLVILRYYMRIHTSSLHSIRRRRIIDALESLSMIVVPVSVSPPPLPLSPYNRTCPNTLPTNGSFFVVAPRALNLPVPPGPGLPVGLLNVSRSPFSVLSPPSLFHRHDCNGVR